MNSNQLISNEEALRLFFNDDVYLVQDATSTQKEGENIEKNIHSDEKNLVDDVKATTPANISVVPKTIAEPKAEYEKLRSFKHLGKNEKGILILVNDTTNPVSTPQGVELLRKLLLSINLKTADFALVNYAHYNTAKFEELNTFFSCKMIISFGVTTDMLRLEAQHLHEMKEVAGIKLIFAHNLDYLETDVASKRTLWGTLKNL